jgi:hypothetical protein
VEYQQVDLFERLCDANPDATCVIAGSAGRSRDELNHRANQRAYHLQQQGEKPGDHASAERRAILQQAFGQSIFVTGVIGGHCRNFIAGYKIPRSVVLIWFKLTENGKIDYRWPQQVAAADANINVMRPAKE